MQSSISQGQPNDNSGGNFAKKEEKPRFLRKKNKTPQLAGQQQQQNNNDSYENFKSFDKSQDDNISVSNIGRNENDSQQHQMKRVLSQNIEEEEKLISSMMEDLRRQKIQQQMLQQQLSQQQPMQQQKTPTKISESYTQMLKQEQFNVFNQTNNNEQKSPLSSNRQGNLLSQYAQFQTQALLSQDQQNQNQSAANQNKSPFKRDLSNSRHQANEVYDELKKRKLEELKFEILNEDIMKNINDSDSRQAHVGGPLKIGTTDESNSYANTNNNSRPRQDENLRLFDSFPLNQQQQQQLIQSQRQQQVNDQKRSEVKTTNGTSNTSITPTKPGRPPKIAANNQQQRNPHQTYSTQNQQRTTSRQIPKYNPVEGALNISSSEKKRRRGERDYSSGGNSRNDQTSSRGSYQASQSQRNDRQKSQISHQRGNDHSQTRSNLHQQSLAQNRSQKSFQQRKKSAIPDSTQSVSSSTPKGLSQNLIQRQQQDHLQQQSQTQLSEKTQQIYFKRLQKEVETSIRLADTHEKGGLDMEEFKQCFYNLEYLPFMMQAEINEDKEKQSQRTLDYTYQTTMRNLILQEKEFVYNLWQILNPLNNNYLDNAMLYDVLLLLIYNVKSPITTTANFLQEYLENLYREENIDLDSFANYNSGSSLGPRSQGQSQLDDHETTLPLSNLDKYLSYNNLWPIEKLSLEFKQIHANKVSSSFSQRQQRSTSPMAKNATQQNAQLIPDDGRKYKKTIIEDHMSQFTFTPNLSSKTKQIDQQLTQKLLQQTLKNDHDNHSGHHYMNTDPDMLQEHDQNANTNLKRYELLYYRQQLKEQKIEKAKENLMRQELDECTFKPQIHQPSGQQSTSAIKSYSHLQRQADQIFKDLSEKIKSNRVKIDNTTADYNQAKLEKDLEECTFKPQIHALPKKAPPKDQVPKGYYQMINRMRKVNDEKKAFEEKMQKKATGENYDKLKLMNIKPPSFVENERKKRKLLMYVDVNITPTKTGRIGIYEGDDVKELAKNFKKAFQLNNQMYHLLTLQLEQHLKVYKDKHNMKDDNGTVFPAQTHKQTPQQQKNSSRNQASSRSPIGRSMTGITAEENGLQVANEMSNEEDEDEEDERDIRNRIIGYNHQDHQEFFNSSQKSLSSPGGVGQQHTSDFNDTQELNDFVRREVQRFDQLERDQRIKRDNFVKAQTSPISKGGLQNFAPSGIQSRAEFLAAEFGEFQTLSPSKPNTQQEKSYISYNDSFRGRD